MFVIIIMNACPFLPRVFCALRHDDVTPFKQIFNWLFQIQKQLFTIRDQILPFHDGGVKHELVLVMACQ